MKPEEFSERLWNFAARVGMLVDALPDTRLGRHVAGQLVRCGTASAPNYDEGCSAESRDDFAHKLSVATKEMRETLGWLGFTIKAKLLPSAKVSSLLDECEQLLKMLSRSVHTAKSRPELARRPNQQSAISHPLFKGLDHLAIIVLNTEEALKLWRDQFGFQVLYSENVNNATVRLTHLDLGNTDLQLVEPLTPAHPLRAWLAKNGSGLHHFCLKVDDVAEAHARLPKNGLLVASPLHQGTQGKRALVLDKSATQGTQVEVTGK